MIGNNPSWSLCRYLPERATGPALRITDDIGVRLLELFDAMNHPDHQQCGDAKAGGENKNDSEQPSFALFVRQMRKQDPSHFFGEVRCHVSWPGGGDNPSMTVRSHPHDQRSGRAKTGHQDQHDDEHLIFALVAGQMRKEQLAGTFYNIFSHSIQVVDFPALPSRLQLNRPFSSLRTSGLKKMESDRRKGDLP
jgi:hypothetical protein